MSSVRIILCSVVAVLMIGASLGFVRSINSPSLFDARSGSKGPQVDVDQDLPAEPASLYRYLRALGLSDDATKPVVLAQLESAARVKENPHAFRYWSVDGARDILLALADEVIRADSLRGEIGAIYPRPAEDPAFARLFRPLGERFSFLSSEQQVRLHKARIELGLAESAQPSNTGSPLSIGRQASGMNIASGVQPESAQLWRALIAEILDEDQLFEYLLRDSALAEQLRISGLEFSEAEFRAAFAVLEQLDVGLASSEYRKARATLRTLLGEQRFDRLWAARDPVYAIVLKTLQTYAYPETTILAAYGVLNRAQDALIDAAALGNSDPMRSIDSAREIFALELEELGELVGEEIAQKILNARAQALLDMREQPFF